MPARRLRDIVVTVLFVAASMILTAWLFVIFLKYAHINPAMLTRIEWVRTALPFPIPVPVPLGGAIIGFLGSLGLALWSRATKKTIDDGLKGLFALTGIVAMIVSFWAAYNFVYGGNGRILSFLGWMAESPLQVDAEFNEHSATLGSWSISPAGWFMLAIQPIGALLGGLIAAQSGHKEPVLRENMDGGQEASETSS